MSEFVYVFVLIDSFVEMILSGYSSVFDVILVSEFVKSCLIFVGSRGSFRVSIFLYVEYAKKLNVLLGVFEIEFVKLFLKNFLVFFLCMIF